MAKVEVDITEYDALRDGKKQAENRVEKLEKEIEEYKSRARCIVTTKTRTVKYDVRKAVNAAVEKFKINGGFKETRRAMGLADPFQLGSLYEPSDRAVIEVRAFSVPNEVTDMLSRYVAESLKENESYKYYGQNEADKYNITESSTEIIGFEDIRLKVEERLQAEYMNELASKTKSLNDARAEYEDKKATVERDVKAEFETRIANARESMENEYNAYKKKVDAEADAKLAEYKAKADKCYAVEEELASEKKRLNAIIEQLAHDKRMLEIDLKYKNECEASKPETKKGFFARLFG